jgi:hypothetical protein
MSIIEPTPSQAAVVLKKFMASNGFTIGLGLAQEAIAAVKGYVSWNVLTANEPPRGSATAKKPCTSETAWAQYEGWEFWSVSGRVSGDDDDSVYQLWVAPGEYPTKLFTAQLREDSNCGDDVEIYCITDTCIGVVKTGAFQLSKSQLPAGLGDMLDSAAADLSNTR